jgi:hypothetical protein
MRKIEQMGSFPTVVLNIALFITALVLISFGYLFYKKDLISLSLSDIGNSIAGPSGLLAFVWLIATVLLQKHEMASMKGAADMQASALEVSARVSLMTHLRDLQERYAHDLRSINNEAELELGEILERLNFLNSPRTMAKNPRQACQWLLWYLIDEKYSLPVDNDFSDVTSDQLKVELVVDGYFAMQSMLEKGSRVFFVLSRMRTFAHESGMQQDQKAFEHALKLTWYQDLYPMLINVLVAAAQVIARGDAEPEYNNRWVDPILDRESFSTPWSNEWLSGKP